MHKLTKHHVNTFKTTSTTRKAKAGELKADTGKKTTVSAVAARLEVVEEFLGLR